MTAFLYTLRGFDAAGREVSIERFRRLTSGEVRRIATRRLEDFATVEIWGEVRIETLTRAAAADAQSRGPSARARSRPKPANLTPD